MPRRRTEPLKKRPTRLSVYLDEDTANAFMKAAVDGNTSVTELLEHLIKNFLRKRPKKGPGKG